MIVHEENPVADAIELKVRLVPCEKPEGEAEVRAELRVKPDDFEDEGFMCVVSFQQVSIQFRLEGLSIIPGSRFNEPLRTSESTEKTIRTRERVSSSANGADLALSGKVSTSLSGHDAQGSASVSAAMKKSSSAAENVKSEYEESRPVFYITARGNNTWDAAEPDGSILDGSYAQDADVLCRVQKTQGGNRHFIEALAIVKHRDIKFDFGGRGTRRFTVNDERLLSLYIAKCIAGPKYAGRIIASTVRIEFD